MYKFIGILFERKNIVHLRIFILHFHLFLSKLCKEYNVKHFIHISSLGINEAIDSNYAKSKLEGEKNILDNFSLSNHFKTFYSLFSR